MTPFWSAFTRIAVLAVLAANVGVMASVCRQYARAWRRASGQRRLTPIHVTLVTLCSLGLEATLAWGQIDALTGGVTPVSGVVLVRTVLYGAFAIGFVVALVAVRQHLRTVTEGG